MHARHLRIAAAVLSAVLPTVFGSRPAVAQATTGAAFPPHAVPRLAGETIKGLPAVTGRIHVDQFGYLPDAQKVAVISDPQKGYNAGDKYIPGNELEVRRKASGLAVFKGAITPWNNGAVHDDSGDRGWWFDFSTVKEPGEYYIYDTSTRLRSPVFKIARNVYYPVLRAAVRMFYFQREAVPIERKYAEGPWTDAAGLLQDREARAVWAKQDATTARDLSGGWMDAGDTNKYPTFLGEVIHPLLHAYSANPKVFGDDYNIPESGNGLPDLLDEVKFELDWLKKMQDADGGVFIKMGDIDHNAAWPVSQDRRPRYYGKKSSASTLWTAGNFAHAARVYGQFTPWKPFADDLRQRAVRAWDWYQANPREYKPDNGEIKSGSANRDAGEHDRMEAFAAIHLWAVTGDARFHKVILDRAGKARQLAEGAWSPYEAGAAEALLDYLKLPGADAALCGRIRQTLASSAGNRGWAPPAEADLYRAWIGKGTYHWGSNSPRACYGYISLQAAEHAGLSDLERTRLTQRGADLLHSFHGVNPLSAAYLSNMKGLGAESSMMYLYHTRWGSTAKPPDNPPPGYVVGGANQSFDGKSKKNDGSIEWISKQPRAKAYADFNLGWPEASWAISEPAIYYQAAYIRLLSAFTQQQ